MGTPNVALKSVISMIDNHNQSLSMHMSSPTNNMSDKSQMMAKFKDYHDILS